MGRAALLVGIITPLAAMAADPPKPNPAHPVNYIEWMNAEFGKPGVANAAQLYEQAAVACVSDAELEKLARAPTATWSEEAQARLLAWVEKNATALEKFGAASKISHCYFAPTPEEPPTVLTAMFPVYSKMRALTYVAIARAKLRGLAGKLPASADDLAATLRAARHMEEQPVLIAVLIGSAQRQLAYSALLDLSASQLDEAGYNAVMVMLNNVDRPVPPRPERQLRMEHLLVWDAAQRLLVDEDGDGRYESVKSELPDLSGKFDAPATLEEILKDADSLQRALRPIFVVDYAASRKAVAEFNQRIGERKTLASIILANPTRVGLLIRRANAARNAAHLALLLNHYRATNGGFPETLDAFVPAESKALRIDPFSGRDFAYKLVGDQPQLYSVGEDGVDDGGQRAAGEKEWSETGDQVFLPRGP